MFLEASDNNHCLMISKHPIFKRDPFLIMELQLPLGIEEVLVHFVKMMLLCLGVKSLDQAGTKRSLSGCAVLSVVPGEKLADPKIDSDSA